MDLDRIAVAAIELISGRGHDGLTMAALARSLGVTPPALYNYVASRDEVFVLLESHVVTAIDVAAFGNQPYEAAVRKWAWSYRQVFIEHKALIPVIAVRPVVQAPKALAMYEAVVSGFRAAGFPEEKIIPAIVAFEAFAFGSAHAVSPADGIFDSVVDGYDKPPADVAFSLGLEALIKGFGALRSPL